MFLNQAARQACCKFEAPRDFNIKNQVQFDFRALQHVYQRLVLPKTFCRNKVDPVPNDVKEYLAQKAITDTGVSWDHGHTNLLPDELKWRGFGRALDRL